MRCLLLLLVLAALPARAQRAAGYVEHGGRLYHFDVTRGGDAVIGHGVEARARMALPTSALDAIVARARAAGALGEATGTDAASGRRLTLDERSVVRVSTAVPVGELALGLLAVVGIGMAAGAAVWERRARRGRTVRRALRRRLAAAREAERSSVARELHDGAVQELCAVQMTLGATLDGHPEGEAARARVAAVVSELRALCEGLRPSALDAFGLPAALAALANRIADAHPLDVRLETSTHAEALAAVLDADRTLALYRIAQEALHNVARHAGARQAVVALRRDGARLTLTVDDDGAGPPDGTPLEYAARGHYGLLGMHERADLLRADLDVGESPLGGTRVAVALRVPDHLLPDEAPAP